MHQTGIIIMLCFLAKGDEWLEIQDEYEVLSDLRTLDTFEIRMQPCACKNNPVYTQVIFPPLSFTVYMHETRFVETTPQSSQVYTQKALLNYISSAK